MSRRVEFKKDIGGLSELCLYRDNAVVSRRSFSRTAATKMKTATNIRTTAISFPKEAAVTVGIDADINGHIADPFI